MPYFADGVISYYVQLLGQPVNFIMNASTTVAVDTLVDNQNLGFVLVPKTFKNTPSVKVQETALIIAIDTADSSAIYYYCQLTNGTVLRLESGKLVYGIDQMDPSAPAELVILPAMLFSNPTHSKRDTPQSNYHASPRGLTGISANTVTVTESACEQMTCIDTGETARYNAFTQSCYCTTLAPAETIPAVTKREDALEPCGLDAWLSDIQWPCICPPSWPKDLCKAWVTAPRKEGE